MKFVGNHCFQLEVEANDSNEALKKLGKMLTELAGVHSTLFVMRGLRKLRILRYGNKS